MGANTLLTSHESAWGIQRNKDPLLPQPLTHGSCAGVQASFWKVEFLALWCLQCANHAEGDICKESHYPGIRREGREILLVKRVEKPLREYC